MAISANDVIRFTVRSTYQGQEADNVFFYLVEAVTATITLLDATVEFYNAWTNVAKALAVSGVNFYGADGLNLMDGSKAAYRPSSTTAGTAATTGFTPSYTAFGIGLIGATGITREGSKRLVGVPEVWIEGNSYTALPGPQLTAVLNFLKTDQTILLADFKPIILGRLPNGDYDMTRINPIVNSQLKPSPTTQNTRKPSRGI